MGNPITGLRIRAERKRLKFTQQEMADKLRISRVAYANYESGNFQPSIESLVQMASEFGCSIDYLLCFSNVREQASPPSTATIPEIIEHLLTLINSSHLSARKRNQLQVLLELASELVNEQNISQEPQ